MKCDNILQLLPDMARGALDESTAATVAQHLGRCNDCREYEQRLVSAFDKLDREAIAEPPQQFWQNFSAEVNARLSPRSIAFVSSPWFRKIAIPVSALACVVIAFVLFNSIRAVNPSSLHASDVTPILEESSNTDLASLIDSYASDPTIFSSREVIVDESSREIEQDYLSLESIATATNFEQLSTLTTESDLNEALLNADESEMTALINNLQLSPPIENAP